MKGMDSIIGYADIKRELRQIIDILKNKEAYDKLGVSTPHGLLLHGDPGVGKTLMASAVMEECGRTAFVCRKDRPKEEFLKHIKETFEKAAANAPSVVFLDDMDKFASDEVSRQNAEEYVTVQSCIDEVKEKEVFVLATVNNIRNLPESLRRAGRFDRTIKVNVPRGRDAEQIIAHYLKNKKCAEDIDIKTIARILDGESCAKLETLINEAGLYAGYSRAETITMERMIEAFIRTELGTSVWLNGSDDEGTPAKPNGADEVCTQIAYHEAGHVVVSEVLCPQSVTLVCLYAKGGDKGGFTKYYNNREKSPMDCDKSRVVGTLAGMAAIEQKFGGFDAGNGRDLDEAFFEMLHLVGDNCICGLHLHANAHTSNSERLMEEIDQVVSAEIERYYHKAKEILAKNRDFFEKIAASLIEKSVLTMADIGRIKESCVIVPVAL